MGRNKVIKELKPEPTSDEISSTELAIMEPSVQKMVAESVMPSELEKIKKIAYYISKVGLSLDESCLLADVNIARFKELMAKNEYVKKIISIKELEFKKDMLLSVSQKARGGDDSLAMWMLEKKYPGEYGKQKGGGGDGSKDMLYEAIEFIQKTGDSAPLVSENAGKSVVLKRGIIRKVEDMLS